MHLGRKRMLDFPSKEIKAESFSRLRNKSVKPTKYLFILSLFKIEVGSKLNKEKFNDLSIIFIG